MTRSRDFARVNQPSFTYKVLYGRRLEEIGTVHFEPFRQLSYIYWAILEYDLLQVQPVLASSSNIHLLIRQSHHNPSPKRGSNSCQAWAVEWTETERVIEQQVGRRSMVSNA